jgi:hypothetical protein
MDPKEHVREEDEKKFLPLTVTTGSTVEMETEVG